jgi:hypothetical protein
VGIAFLNSLQAKVLSKGGIVLAFQIFLRIICVWEDIALEPVAGRERVC